MNIKHKSILEKVFSQKERSLKNITEEEHEVLKTYDLVGKFLLDMCLDFNLESKPFNYPKRELADKIEFEALMFSKPLERSYGKLTYFQRNILELRNKLDDYLNGIIEIPNSFYIKSYTEQFMNNRCSGDIIDKLLFVSDGKIETLTNDELELLRLHGRINEYVEKGEIDIKNDTPLSYIANSYFNGINSYNSCEYPNLLLRYLPNLKIDNFYILDDYRSRTNYNSVLNLYARPLDKHQPDDKEFESYRYGKMKMSVPYRNPFEYITLPFTANAIWEAYLLKNTYHILGMRGNGNYEKRLFINSLDDIYNIENVENLEYFMNFKKDRVFEIWDSTLLPKIEFIDNNSALIQHCWINPWQGLMLVKCKVEYDINKCRILSFTTKEEKLLLQYECGIRF